MRPEGREGGRAGIAGAAACLLCLASACWPLQDRDQQLIAAAREGDAARIENLLARGADLHAREKNGPAANDLGETALMAAALRGHVAAVQALLDGGAPLEAIDSMGSTALILASMGVLYEGGGSAATVRLLLAAGADVNASNDDGITALIGAASRGNRAVVEALLAAGADREAQIFHGQDQGETALSLALRNGHAETVRLLQADPAAGSGGKTEP